MDNSNENVGLTKRVTTTLERRIAETELKRATLEQKLQQLKGQQQQIQAKQRAAESKRLRAQHNQAKFALGGLLEIAGLLDIDRGALLGAFLIIAERLNGPTFFSGCKQRGDELLAQREADRQARKHARQTATEPTEAEEQP